MYTSFHSHLSSSLYSRNKLSVSSVVGNIKYFLALERFKLKFPWQPTELSPVHNHSTLLDVEIINGVWIGTLPLRQKTDLYLM